MRKFSVISSWLSSIACGVCLVLAVLATPGVARADPDCSCCGTDPGAGDYAGHQQWMNCMSQCAATGTCGGLVIKSSCPNGSRSSCSQDDGMPNGCPNLLCTEPPNKWACGCVYDMGTSKCNCPP
jgi:hypothetical protein